MKKVLYYMAIIVALISMSSCSSYYYSVLSSTDWEGERSPDGDFLQENDTVRIAYNFSGEDAPVNISIYNKLDKPLYVDWTRSAIIIDEKTTNYFNGQKVQFNAEVYPHEIVGGIQTLRSGVDMIPPKSLMQHQPLTLANFPFDKIPNKEFRKTRYAKNESEAVYLRVKEYTEEDAPLYFRSFLTLFTEEEGGKRNNQYFERSFYTSTLIKAGSLAPSSFRPMQQGVGDTFYVKKVKGKNFGYAVGTIAIIAGAVAIEVALGPYDEY